jgi:hypothetical protein
LKPLPERDLRRAPLADNAPASSLPVNANVSAWEMIETGRYMPRRIRGSFPGRELG